VPDLKAGFACGSMLRFLSFSQKCGSVSHIFVKKDVQFRSAVGNIHFQGRDRITPVTLHALRGGSANWAFAHGNGRFRLRQRGTFFTLPEAISSFR